MKTLVVGAGAIGGYFGAVLARANYPVTMLARGDHLETLRTRGIEIVNGPDAGRIPVNAVDDLRDVEAPDLVLFAVKSYHTQEACLVLRPVLREQTIVLELQNGVDRAQEIQDLLESKNVLAGTVYMEARLEAPGVVHYLSGARRIVFGETHGPITPRVVELRDRLKKAGINAQAFDDVRIELWRKFVLICAANALTALTKQPFGDIVGHPPGRQLVKDVIQEAVSVGARLGINLGADAAERSVSFLEGMGPQLRSSMLRDIEMQRKTEVETLNGYLVRQADEYGLDVPLNRLIWVALSLHNERVVT